MLFPIGYFEHQELNFVFFPSEYEQTSMKIDQNTIDLVSCCDEPNVSPQSFNYNIRFNVMFDDII